MMGASHDYQMSTANLVQLQEARTRREAAANAQRERALQAELQAMRMEQEFLRQQQKLQDERAAAGYHPEKGKLAPHPYMVLQWQLGAGASKDLPFPAQEVSTESPRTSLKEHHEFNYMEDAGTLQATLTKLSQQAKFGPVHVPDPSMFARQVVMPYNKFDSRLFMPLCIVLFAIVEHARFWAFGHSFFFFS
jgi:hypothetical protein